MEDEAQMGPWRERMQHNNLQRPSVEVVEPDFSEIASFHEDSHRFSAGSTDAVDL